MSHVEIPKMRRPKAGHILNFCWGAGDEIVLFNSPKPSTDEVAPIVDATRSETKSSENIASFSWDNSPEECAGLARVGASCFGRVQETLSLPTKSEKRLELRSISKELRKKLAECTLKLDSRIRDAHIQGRSSERDEEDLLEKQNLAVANSAWHLCEIMALSEDGPMLPLLLDWVQEHYPRFNLQELETQLNGIPAQGGDSEVFWSLAYDLVLNGNTEKAWEVIQSHSNYRAVLNDENDAHISVYNDVRDLLLSMPKLEIGASPSKVQDFRATWIQWNKTIQVVQMKHPVLSGANRDLNVKLNELVKLISGDRKTLLDKCKKGTWVHSMTAILLYQQPTITKNALGKLARQCIQMQLSQGEDESRWPTELRLWPTILDGDFTLALQLLHSCVGDRWVDAHLADLMGHARVIETTSLGFEAGEYPDQFFVAGMQMDMREYFIFQYALQLGLRGRQPVHGTASTKSWTVPQVYLQSLNRMVNTPSGAVEKLGREGTEIVLSHALLTDDRTTRRIVRLADQLGLGKISSEIRQVRAMYWWCYQGRREKTPESSFKGIANALLWAALVGKDYARLLIGRILNVGNTSALDTLVDHLGGSLKCASGDFSFDDEIVALLSSYHEVRYSLKIAEEMLGEDPEGRLEKISEQRHNALTSLCNLLNDEIVPKKIWAPLIRQVLMWKVEVEAIRHVPLRMTMAEAQKLLTCLQQLEVSHLRDELIGSKSSISPQDLTMMYYLLNQGMAHSVMFAGRRDLGNVPALV